MTAPTDAIFRLEKVIYEMGRAQRFGYHGGRGEMLAAGHGHHTETLRFTKTGAEIQGSLEKKIGLILKDIEEDKKEIAEICKKRDLTVDEVLGADDDEKVEAYSSKAMSNSPSKVSSAVRELQQDLDNLKAFTWGIKNQESQITNFNRIKSNIEPGRKFDLTYSELVEYGF